MMRNDQDQEFAKKGEEEESFKEKMDPLCPGCHQRVVSQGCVCSKPKPKPKPPLKPMPKPKTPDANKDRQGIIWIREKDGSFTYSKPGLFSINVNDQRCTLFFSKKNPDFEKVYKAFTQFELDNDLILNKDFKIVKNNDRLIISFSTLNQYEKFIDYLSNTKIGLSDELQSALRSLPKLAPKGSKKAEKEEIDNVEKKSAIKSPFRIPDLGQGPSPFDL